MRRVHVPPPLLLLSLRLALLLLLMMMMTAISGARARAGAAAASAAAAAPPLLEHAHPLGQPDRARQVHVEVHVDDVAVVADKGLDVVKALFLVCVFLWRGGGEAAPGVGAAAASPALCSAQSPCP